MHWKRKMATQSSVLAWRIPGMGEPGGLPSMGSHRVGHNWSDLAAAAAGEKSISGMENSKCKGFEAERCLWKWKLLSHAWLFVTPWTIHTVHEIVEARILQWRSPSPLSRGSPQLRDRTQVSHIAGGFFTSWATREAQDYWIAYPFSSRSSQPGNGTRVSCITSGLFTNWATKERCLV